MNPEQDRSKRRDKPPVQQQQQQPQTGSAGVGAQSALERLKEWEKSRTEDRPRETDRAE